MSNRQYQQSLNLRGYSSRVGQNPPSHFPRASEPSSYNADIDYSIPKSSSERRSEIGAQNTKTINMAKPHQDITASSHIQYMQSIQPSSQHGANRPSTGNSRINQEHEEAKNYTSKLASNKPSLPYNQHQMEPSIPRASPLLVPNLLENKNVSSQDYLKGQPSRPWTQASPSRGELGDEVMGNSRLSNEANYQQPAVKNPNSIMNSRSQGVLNGENGVPPKFSPFPQSPMPGPSSQQIALQGIKPVVSPPPVLGNQGVLEHDSESSAINQKIESDTSIPFQNMVNPNLEQVNSQQFYKPNFPQKEISGPVPMLSGSNPSLSQPKPQQIAPKQQFSIMNAKPSGNNQPYSTPNRLIGENNQPKPQGSIKQVVVSRDSMPRSKVNKPLSTPMNQQSSPINQPITPEINNPPFSQIDQPFVHPRSQLSPFPNNQPFSTPNNQPFSPSTGQPLSSPINQPFASPINQPFLTPSSQPIKINPPFSGQNPQTNSINPPFSSSIRASQQSQSQNIQSIANNPYTSSLRPPNDLPTQYSPNEQPSQPNNPYSSPSPYQLQSSHEIANSNQFQSQAPLSLPPPPSNPNQFPRFLPTNPGSQVPSSNSMSNPGFLPQNSGPMFNNPGSQLPSSNSMSNPGFQPQNSGPMFNNPGFQLPSSNSMSNPGFKPANSYSMNNPSFPPQSSNPAGFQQPTSSPIGFQTPNNFQPPNSNSMGFQPPYSTSMNNPGFSIPSTSSIPQDQSPSEQGESNSRDIPCHPQIFSKINPGSSLKNQLKQNFGVDLCYNGSNIRIFGPPQNLELAAACISQKLAQESSSRNIKWTFMKDDGQFKPYSDAICNVIENAYARKANEVNINIDGRTYKIIFGNPHRQVLPNSNISRTVRRMDGSEEEIVNKEISENEVTWYWQDDNQRSWKAYTKEASRQIEAAYKNKERKVLVQGFNVKAYLIDLEKLVQLNEQTRFSRKVRRGP